VQGNYLVRGLPPGTGYPRRLGPHLFNMTAAPRGVTARAIVLGLILAAVNCYWVTVMEVRWYSLDGSSLPLFVSPVFFLFMLVMVNLALKRWLASVAFSSAELLTIYVMLVISVAMSGHDTLQNLMGTIGHAYWFGTPENKWPSLFFRYLPKWLVVSDHAALKGYYEGDSWWLPYWRVWLVPLASWAVLMMTVFCMLLCWNVIIRRVLADEERLSFPIIQTPLGLLQEGGSRLTASGLMWIGFALAGGMTVLNGLHVLYPTLPYINVRAWDEALSVKFPQHPWSAMGALNFNFYPFAIGIGYFLPAELAFSCWFFFLIAKFERVVAAAAGWDATPDFPYIPEQASGAWIGVAALVVWSMRHHFAAVGRTVIGSGGLDDTREPFRYRWAAAGLVACFIVLVIFCGKMGMPWWLTIAFFAIFLFISLALTHMRAQFGAPHEISSGSIPVHPQGIMVSIFGVEAFTPRALTAMSLMWWMHRGYRNHPMPNQLDAFKMAEPARAESRRLALTMVIAAAVSIIATYYSNLVVCYRDGAAAKTLGVKKWVGSETFDRLKNMLEGGLVQRPGRLWAMLFAGCFVLAMGFLHRGVPRWPFHPTGYALGISYATTYFWSCFAVAWLLKILIIRYGGMRLHNRLVPFFLGLILGQYVVGSIWAILGPAYGFRNYKIYI
jgi:hypothetical protein